MRTWEIVVRTANSVYQLRSRPNGFRRVSAGADGLHSDPWQAFQRMGPVLRGQPLRLWWSTASRGRSQQAGVLVTGPVVDVAVREAQLPDSGGAEPAPTPEDAEGASGGTPPAVPSASAAALPVLPPTDPVLSDVVAQLDEQDRREQ